MLSEPADAPNFVRELYSGGVEVTEPLALDADAVRELTVELRALEDARAAAVVSGRTYLVR